MKNFHLWIILVAISACIPEKSNDSKAKGASNKTKAILNLSSDSGFITKKIGHKFLVEASLSDTSKNWDLLKSSDTIGKYYKVGSTGNYFACLIDYSDKYAFETHLLLELSPNGNLLKSERYIHGNYPCCWDNYYSGFGKMGNYFYIETCATGSGFCASELYLFKNIKPQDSIISVPNNCFISMTGTGLSYKLNSRVEFKSEYLIMHYLLQKGIFDDQNKFQTKKTENFDIRFDLVRNSWLTSDSSTFEKHGIYF